jgi:hypothetical protein
MGHGRVKTRQRIGGPARCPMNGRRRASHRCSGLGRRPRRACVGRCVVNRGPRRAGCARRCRLDGRARRRRNGRGGCGRRARRRRNWWGGCGRWLRRRRNGRRGCDRRWACRCRRWGRCPAVGTELGAVRDTLAALCTKHGKPLQEMLEMWAGAIVRRSGQRFNGTRGTMRAAAQPPRRNARPTPPRYAVPRSISPFVLREQRSRP